MTTVEVVFNGGAFRYKFNEPLENIKKFITIAKNNDDSFMLIDNEGKAVSIAPNHCPIIEAYKEGEY